MILDSTGIKIKEYDIYKSRKCKQCNDVYDLNLPQDSYLYPPHDYSRGFQEYCLDCWLLGDNSSTKVIPPISVDFKPSFPSSHSGWYNQDNLIKIAKGDLNLAYEDYIDKDCHIIVIPISRVHIDKTIFFPSGVLFFPKGILDLERYQLEDTSIFDDYKDDRYTGEKLVKLQSFLSGITIKDYKEETLIALPMKFKWESIYKCTHNTHMNFIRKLSEIVDEAGFKYLKYKNCNLDFNLESRLPSYVGQVSTNIGMSSCLLINIKTNEQKLIGGNAYSHQFTSGVGLKINQPEWGDFPKNGEVGKFASHALSLYMQMIQSQSNNSRYVQALSLLEYLAYPKEYKPFKDVKKVIAKYVAKDNTHKVYLYERFHELTGKKDSETNEHIGLRTLIVHIGANIETLLESKDIEKVFVELDGYIKEIIDFMIKYSDMDYDDYFTNKVKFKY